MAQQEYCRSQKILDDARLSRLSVSCYSPSGVSARIYYRAAPLSRPENRGRRLVVTSTQSAHTLTGGLDRNAKLQVLLESLQNPKREFRHGHHRRSNPQLSLSRADAAFRASASRFPTR